MFNLKFKITLIQTCAYKFNSSKTVHSFRSNNGGVAPKKNLFKTFLLNESFTHLNNNNNNNNGIGILDSLLLSETVPCRGQEHLLLSFCCFLWC